MDCRPSDYLEKRFHHGTYELVARIGRDKVVLSTGSWEEIVTAYKDATNSYGKIMEKLR